VALRGFGSRRRAGGGDVYADPTAKLNGADPQAWLADVLARINDHKITDLAALLPWRWAADQQARKRAA
jgi:hypothetical protein